MKKVILCHIRHFNPLKIHPERNTKQDKGLINNLDDKRIEFPMSIKDFNKIVVRSKIFINVFCYENTLSYPILISDQKFKNSMDLLIISDKIQSHYVYIKDFNKLMFNKTKNKNKKYFCKYCFQCFSSEKTLAKYKKIVQK